MNKIASFTVNHLDLLTGAYVSRKDYQGDVVLTTFDLRFTRPNVEAPMDTAGIHTIEHLVATFLRNHKVWADKTIYFGPMGCRTGFYVIFAGDLESEDIAVMIIAFILLPSQTIIIGASADLGRLLSTIRKGSRQSDKPFHSQRRIAAPIPTIIIRKKDKNVSKSVVHI